MAQRNAVPVVWKPKGLSDTLDGTTSFAGAMSSLQNLIPDPTTSCLWQCRPASIEQTNFFAGSFSSGFSSGFQVGTAFSTPGFISCMLIVGNFVYGMIATRRNAGHDEPFCFNLLTGSFVLMGGTITSTTTPTSPPTTGAWTPPIMQIVGAFVVVTHPGFTGVSNNFFGWINISNPAAPTWNAGNFTGPAGLTFTVAPTGIAQFNGRAYFIHNAPAAPALIFSDVNNPTKNTGSVTPVLTFGDTTLLTSVNALPLGNQVVGGVIQSLIVFKGTAAMFQITGDASTSNLASNNLNVATGTLSPLAVCSTPKGLTFVAPDGIRNVDFYAQVSDPIGIDGKGVNVPFQLVVNPSRTVMTCNGNVLRVTLQNGNVGGAPAQEFWYDFARGIFSGPHTFPASLILPWLNTFIVSPISPQSSLWRSDPVQSLTSTFVENGTQLTWLFNTAPLPDTETVTNNCMTEATLDIALAAGIPPTVVNAVDQGGSVMGSVSLSGQTGATIWGQFHWGAAPWGGPTAALAPQQLQWPNPITFAKMQLQVSGQSNLGTKIGKFELLIQKLKTWKNIAVAA